MQQQELNNLMQGAAADAVNYAAEEHQLTLDHSIDSLQQIDVLLAELHSREQKHFSIYRSMVTRAKSRSTFSNIDRGPRHGPFRRRLQQ